VGDLIDKNPLIAMILRKKEIRMIRSVVLSFCLLLALVGTGCRTAHTGPTLMIQKSGFSTSKYYVSSMETSTTEILEKEMVLVVGYDEKGLFMSGVSMMIKGEVTACVGQIIEFGDSFRASGKSIRIGTYVIKSNGTVALLNNREIRKTKWTKNGLIPIE
jgi:hypothetical protein